jgi:hypothetical protein
VLIVEVIWPPSEDIRRLALFVHFEKAMNQTITSLIIAALGLSTLSRAAQVEARADFSGDGLRSFYFAIGNYYQVPEHQVDLVRERALLPDEVPVAFFVAQRAGVNPAVVVDLRRRSMSWSDIALHFHFRPDIYYFPEGPPYGKAYGYWKSHPPRDAEVIDAVNIHFLSEFHHVSPDLVRTERSRRGNYAVIARDFEAKSHKSDDRGKHEADTHGNGHGHGKGHDR